MGAGASSATRDEAATSLETATPEALQDLVAGSSEAARKRLRAALDKAEASAKNSVSQLPATAEQTDPALVAVVEAAVAVAVAARKEDTVDEGQQAWQEHGGAKLEAALEKDAALGDSAVRLVDARFLIELHKQGGRLPRRQLLPDGAFLTLDDLKRLPAGGSDDDCLRIAATSHAWQQPDTPDPKGLTLKLLAEFLQVLLSKEVKGGGKATYGIFIDFNSLHQKSASGERSAAEAELFGRALSNMMIWYSHRKLLTLKLTKLPPGYPQGFDFPPGMTPNVAEYFDRGWCFCESSVSGMAKDFDYVFDLAKFSGTKDELVGVIKECTAERPPPLTPDDFALALSSKSFTSKKADEKMVADLYAATFHEQMGAATKLMYSNLQWGDAHVTQLCKVVASGALDHLTVRWRPAALFPCLETW